MEDLYQSESRMENLKRRAKRCVCKYYGQPLSLKRILFSDHTDARVEIYCDVCQRIEYGVEPEIYQSAQNFVDDLEFNYYNDLAQNEETYRMNVAKVAEIIAWGYQSGGLLDETGFTVPLKNQGHLQEQCLVITEQELQEMDAASASEEA